MVIDYLFNLCWVDEFPEGEGGLGSVLNFRDDVGGRIAVPCPSADIHITSFAFGQLLCGERFDYSVVVASNVNDRFEQSFWFFVKEMGWSFEVGQA